MKKNYKYETHPNYIVKKPKLLYIDRYGKIYPDCKTYITPPICHISDSNVLKTINDTFFGVGQTGIFNMITIEVSSLCHANCFYCFQKDQHRSEKYQYYDLLLPLLKQIKCYWLFFSGGEILIQKDAMEFMEKIRKVCPDNWIHLKTNGNADLDAILFVEQTCDSLMVSFNGFSSASYNMIMQLDIYKTIRFCETLISNRKVNVGLKFLNSPAVISEAPSFLEWALSKKAQCVVIQTAYNYIVEDEGKSTRINSTFDNCNETYWNDIYIRVSTMLNAILEKNKDNVNCGFNYLTADKELFQLLSISEENQKLIRTDGVYVIE